MVRSNLLKRLDAAIGPIMVSVISMLFRPGKSQEESVNSVLFIRPGGIGDAVMLMPAILLLKKQYPDANVSVLAEKRNSAIFSLCPSVDHVYHYDRPKELFKLFRKRYDIIIDTEQWHRLSAVVARLVGASMLLGFDTNDRRRLFTHAIPYSHDDYELESFVHLLAPILGNREVDMEKPFLTIPENLLGRIKTLIDPSSGKQRVVMFPGGSIKERRWGADKFREAAVMLINAGFYVILVGGKEDIPRGKEITGGLSNILNLCGKLSLVETAFVIREASLVITGDSGIMHIAFGLGTPVLALFGPGIEKKWTPRGTHDTVINKNLECSPCTQFGYTSRCKKDAECMKLITVEEVYEKAIEVLER